MARFIHIADARVGKRIQRHGLAASKLRTGERAVFCVPIVPDRSRTFQWVRELKRRGYRKSCAVYFEIPDDESVLIGCYSATPQAMTAAEASSLYRTMAEPGGVEVLIPRKITSREILKVTGVPEVAGWRFYPEAKGRAPFWPAPGEARAAKLRRLYEQRLSAQG